MFRKTGILSGILAVLLVCGESQITPANQGDFEETHSPSVLFGSWRDPRTGDSYVFERNQTYTFRAGRQKSRSGNLSHGGTWSIHDLTSSAEAASSDLPAPHLPPEAQPHGLRLKATYRQVLLQGRIQKRPARRVFELTYQRIKLNPPPGVSVYLSKKGRYYYFREPNNPQNVHKVGLASENNPNRLLIGQTAFVRMK